MTADELNALRSGPAWLCHYENSNGGHHWAIVIDKAPPELIAGYDGQILAIYELVGDTRFIALPALKAMAFNGTLKKMETQHG